MRLDGRVAVITGAGSGIGAASALAMAKEGARVVVVDLNEASAKATADPIEKACGRVLSMHLEFSPATFQQTIVQNDAHCRPRDSRHTSLSVRSASATSRASP